MDGEPENWKVSEEKKKEVEQYLKGNKPTHEEWESLCLTEKANITNIEAAEKIDLISRQIQKALEQITSFIKLYFAEDALNISSKKELDRLNVKQQVIILSYLFAYFQNSGSEIPNNKLSQLLGKVLVSCQ